LTPLLCDTGHDVVGLDCALFTTGTLGPAPPEVPMLEMDVREIRQQDLNGFDAVIHLAGISNDPVGDLAAQVTYDINYHAAVRLARLAKAAGVGRFLFASSCSLYGASAGHGPLTETAEFRPVTPYGESKASVERDLTLLADATFSPVYLRCATAYGASPRLRSDLVVNDLTGRAVISGEVRLRSDGTAWRPLVHVEDIARAYVAMLDAPRQAIHNQAFNVARNDENYQVRQVAEIVREEVAGSEITYSESAGKDQRCYIVDCSKLQRTVPAFQARWTVRDGVRQLQSAFLQEGMDIQRFTGPDFLRLARIKQLKAAGSLSTELRWVRAAG